MRWHASTEFVAHTSNGGGMEASEEGRGKGRSNERWRDSQREALPSALTQTVSNICPRGLFWDDEGEAHSTMMMLTGLREMMNYGTTRSMSNPIGSIRETKSNVTLE